MGRNSSSGNHKYPRPTRAAPSPGARRSPRARPGAARRLPEAMQGCDLSTLRPKLTSRADGLCRGSDSARFVILRTMPPEPTPPPARPCSKRARAARDIYIIKVMTILFISILTIIIINCHYHYHYYCYSAADRGASAPRRREAGGAVGGSKGSLGGRGLDSLRHHLTILSFNCLFGVKLL